MNGSLSLPLPSVPLPGNDCARLRLLVLGSMIGTASDDWPCTFIFDGRQPFDGLVVTGRGLGHEVERILREQRAWMAPVADLSGDGLWFADQRGAEADPDSLRIALEPMLRIHAVARELPVRATGGDDPAMLLLARIHTRGRRLAAEYDPGLPQLVRYPAAGLLPHPQREAERLTAAGLLARSFFDRLHVCPTCASSRLNVREECSSCRTSDLLEETLVHHFRCAHQAPERQFVQGMELICPKCRRRLRHFGVDYDRPGSVMTCRACGHLDADPRIGFVCMDCRAHADATSVTTRDWHDYTLSADGEEYLCSPGPRDPGAAVSRDGFHLLAEHCLRVRSRYGRPLSVLGIRFAKIAKAERSAGARATALARRQAAEIVRGELRDTDFLLDTSDRLLVVLPETDARALEAPRLRLLRRLNEMLAVDLGVEINQVHEGELPVTIGGGE